MRQAALAIAAAALLAGAGGADSRAAKDPRCFGAAARDPLERCVNPRLRLKVTPTPNKAAVTPNLACTRVTIDEAVEQCAFGVPADEAEATVAMVGDSHAAHWRAALAVVARAKRWRVLEVATPHCPFSAAVPRSDTGGDEAEWCPPWNQQVLRWLSEHPEVRTLFVSNHSKAPIHVPEGADPFETRVDGFARMWESVPASVERIVVIRDNPLERFTTHDCVRRAMRRRKPAGRACALPRDKMLHDDAGVPAVARVAATRPIGVVDLTHHFCGRERCFPVVGGVLVHKDTDHVGRLFSRTLGPYLLRGAEQVLGAAAPQS